MEFSSLNAFIWVKGEDREVDVEGEDLARRGVFAHLALYIGRIALHRHLISGHALHRGRLLGRLLH